MNTVITIGISLIGIFVTFILLKRGKVLADYVLIAINIVLAFMLLSNAWIENGINTVNYYLNTVLPFWLFALFMTYGLLLIDEQHQFRWKWFWIYAYPLLFLLVVSIDLFAYPHDVSQLEEQYKYPSLLYHAFYKSHSVYVIFVILWFLKQLNTYQKSIKNYYSFIEPIQLQWLKYFALILMFLYTLAVTVFLIYNFGFIEDISFAYQFLNIGTVLSIFYLSFNGIRQYSLAHFQNSIQPAQASSEQGTTEPKTEKEKYATSSLTNEEANRIFQKLEALFQAEAIYTEPQLKIKQVADRLQISTHQLSQVINSVFGKSFYEFVNTYRVDLLKERLRDPESKAFTILALAYDCGFNSKASLNRIFKEHTELTPSQYQKAHLIK